MTVKELKQRLERADDEAIVCLENKDYYKTGLYRMKSAVQCDNKLLIIEGDYLKREEDYVG